jgi:hypothetical protein
MNGDPVSTPAETCRLADLVLKQEQRFQEMGDELLRRAQLIGQAIENQVKRVAGTGRDEGSAGPG